MTIRKHLCLTAALALMVHGGTVSGAATSMLYKVDDRTFYTQGSQQAWNPIFITGVNIGAAMPSKFPGELGITKAMYRRWFKQIARMNANTIRVYTTLMPAFYEALAEFNRTAPKPLYLIHGVWVDEVDMATLSDAHHPKIKDTFIQDAKTIIDILHGKGFVRQKPGHAYGRYTRDVSKYVIGWILGVEWDPYFVQDTNTRNAHREQFVGQYLYTSGASPFEIFLAEVGDAVIRYEQDRYGMQRPLAFVNWLTTDPLTHPNEPMEQEDMSVVDTEHVKAGASFSAGLFASYHVYPYYPDFLNYQKDYSQFIDEKGQINTYRAYLRELRQRHQVPVLVSEFGVPASRGAAHRDLHRGYDQGQIDETEQGMIDASLLEDIHAEGYAGGLVFSWQDEWFKRTWNNMDFDLPDRRPFWSNPQTNEQEFGLLAFDPGKRNVCLVDGRLDEWADQAAVATQDGTRLFMKSDEKYVYFRVDAPGFNPDEDTLLIPVDTLPNQGNYSSVNHHRTFSRAADFLIHIEPAKESRIMVDAHYDSFYRLYAHTLHQLPLNGAYELFSSGLFSRMNLALNRALYLPVDRVTLPFSYYETGLLQAGNGNPRSPSFKSLTDYAYNNGHFEIRIPWQLLNFADPSTRQVMSDIYAPPNGTVRGVPTQTIKHIFAGAGIESPQGDLITPIKMGAYRLKEWDLPTYHERLKPSYYRLKQAFSSY